MGHRGACGKPLVVPQNRRPRPEPAECNLIAEIELAEEPEWGLRRDALGIHSLSSMGDGVR
jgi:hypothetical protein